MFQVKYLKQCLTESGLNIHCPESFSIDNEESGEIEHYTLCENVPYKFIDNVLIINGFEMNYSSFRAYYYSSPIIIQKKEADVKFYYNNTFQIQVLKKESIQKFSILSNDYQGQFMKKPRFRYNPSQPCFDVKKTVEMINIKTCLLCYSREEEVTKEYYNSSQYNCFFCEKKTYTCNNDLCKNNRLVSNFFNPIMSNDFINTDADDFIKLDKRRRVCQDCSEMEIKFSKTIDKMSCSSKRLQNFFKSVVKKNFVQNVISKQTLEECIACNSNIFSSKYRLDIIIFYVIFNLMDNIQFLNGVTNPSTKEEIEINNKELIESFKEEIEINFDKHPRILMKIRKYVYFLMRNFGTEYKVHLFNKKNDLSRDIIKLQTFQNYLSQVPSLQFKKNLSFYGIIITVENIFD